MNLRLRNGLKDWVVEAGILHILVIALVGLFFLIKNWRSLFPDDMTFSRKAIVGEAPKYYGRTP